MSNRTTHVALVVDHSPSMGKRDPLELTDGIIKTLRANQGTEGKILVTEVQFHHDVKIVSTARKLRGYPKAKLYIYGRATALYRAMMGAFDTLEVYDNRASNIAFLMIVMTDGQNNRERDWEEDLQARITRAQASGQWTILFLTTADIPNLGIEDGNIHQYGEVIDLLRAGQPAVERFMKAREVGLQAVDDLVPTG